MSNFWTRTTRFPPILVRLLAKHDRGRPLTTTEIAAGAGLTTWQVEALSWSCTWDGVDLTTFRKFTAACNLDLTNHKQMKRAETYLRGKRGRNGERLPCLFRYLKNDPAWLPYYLPMMTTFLRTMAPAPMTQPSRPGT